MYFSIHQLSNFQNLIALSSNRWNPKVGFYLEGSRHGYDVFKPTIAIRLFRRAVYFSKSLSSLKLIVVFGLGYPPDRSRLVHYPKRVGQPYVVGRILNGFLTNFRITAPTRNFHYEDSRAMPMGLILADPVTYLPLASEARRLGIPVVALSGSNLDPRYFSYPVLGNSSSFSVVQSFLHFISFAMFQGLMAGTQFKSYQPPTRNVEFTPPLPGLNCPAPEKTVLVDYKQLNYFG